LVENKSISLQKKKKLDFKNFCETIDKHWYLLDGRMEANWSGKPPWCDQLGSWAAYVGDIASPGEEEVL
jgi:hypothetical protein